MRILLLADSSPGLFVSKFLFEQKENIVGLCVHEAKHQNKVKEIIRDEELLSEFNNINEHYKVTCVTFCLTILF